MTETVLENGVRVLSEPIGGVRSVAVGVWVRQGAAHESDAEAGASHLLEHLVFKGTRKRTAQEIAHALEGLGGTLDAYTSREHTSYQARVLDEHLPEALDVLADLVLDPRLDEDDLALEREVVLEEIAQVEDTPDDLVFELHSERLWNGHPYGRSILGTKESVAGMKVDGLRAVHGERYCGENLIVAATGNVTHSDFHGRVSDLFGGVAPGERTKAVASPPAASLGAARVTRGSAQTHVVFGGVVPGHPHPDRYPLVLVSAALGSGMSSRLFQKVREELGLCYSVYTYQAFYRAAGVSGVYLGTRPATAAKAVAAVRAELAKVAAEGLSQEELDAVKRQVKGHLTLTLESTGARLHRLAGFALHEEPLLGLDGLLAKIDRVTSGEVERVSLRYWNPEQHLELRLGPDQDEVEPDKG